MKDEIKKLNEKFKIINEKESNDKINEYKNLYEKELNKNNKLKNDFQELKILFEQLIKNRKKKLKSKNVNINDTHLFQIKRENDINKNNYLENDNKIIK